MRNVREVLADTLGSLGIDTVFGVMGATNQDLLCHLAQDPAIRVVHARHESAAVSMADGYARFSGRPGCASVTAGPGLSNTATALAVARSHGSPVLLVAGDTSTSGSRNPQQLDQDSFGHLMAGSSGTVRCASDLPRVLGEAAKALAAHRPYVLNLPVDIQISPASRLAAVSPPLMPHPVRPDADSTATAAELLAAAARPAVLAGRGALHAGSALADLAGVLGAALATTLPAHGLFAGNRLNTGLAGALGSGNATRVLTESDVLLAAGTSLHPLTGITPDGVRRIIRLDTDQNALAGHGPQDVTLHGDTTLGAQALHEAVSSLLSGRPTSAPWAEPEPVAIPADYLDTSTTLDPRHALAVLRAMLPPDAGLVIGGGQAAVVSCQMLPATDTARWTCASTDFGAIGQALPVAIGACFDHPTRRVVHLTGDGDLMMSLADLHTAVRYDLPLTVVILNDQGFGQERQDLHRKSLPAAHAQYPAPDFAALANAMGAQGHRIQSPTELPLLAHAFPASPAPVVIDVRTNPEYHNPACEDIAHVMSAQPTPTSE
ncbi:thiamine pyrophosphate-binding protein [Streptomyces lavendofoliae]|uniref:thiamine pyrophosphate-binding protein n=1 Tax=Streptomyces lavendofoliae TaxID=67314 RepID=UPI003D93421E